MSAVSRGLLMPGPGEAWREGRRPVPEPGPGQVLVAVGAVGVNYHDLANAVGLIDGPWPRIPMTDAAGTVVATGAGVSAWSPGDRVMSTFYPRWADGPITARKTAEVPGDTLDGWLQEHRVCRLTELVAVPEHLSLAEAASLPCAATTAWSSLERGRVEPGDVVIAMGTGGVSLFVLQLAKARGATVIALSSSDDKLAVASALGADHLVNYREGGDWPATVRSLTDGGADLVVDVAGQETLALSVRAVRPGGTVAVVGVLSGFGEPAFPVSHVMLRNISVVGVTVGSVADQAAMVAAFGGHGLHPHISHTFGWLDARAALDLIEAGGHIGKVALEVG